MIKLSVIIVNYNVNYFLVHCLRSVAEAIEGQAVEVFVVDNNSTDNSVESVKRFFPWVKLIENKQNTGFSKANNQAIVEAKGEYVLLLNPDTVVAKDCFAQCIEFMDNHPDAGGMGAMMLDGKGEFLPESKRGLPTPEVAFYKIFGLSSIFKKSKKFGRYHLSYLDVNEKNEIDVLSGAFMLMRKKALDISGLLDETFFMYGEDIDLSYRILKSGFKNYYNPAIKIIHYKGESTKKGSLNYVFVFYEAMLIFAKKHFSSGAARLYSLVINFAIYLRASLAIFSRISSKIYLPLLDLILSVSTFFVVKSIYTYETAIQVPETIFYPAMVGFGGLHLLTSFLVGCYDRPIVLKRSFYAFVLVSVLVLGIYALIPETFRFSRAIMSLSLLVSYALHVSLRLSLAQVFKSFTLAFDGTKTIAIIGSKVNCEKAKDILQQNGSNTDEYLFIAPTRKELEAEPFFFTAACEKAEEIYHFFTIYETILCPESIGYEASIEFMLKHKEVGTRFKILPKNEDFIIGSDSIDTNGMTYYNDINFLIQNKDSIRKKRLFDFFLATILLVLYPLLFPFFNNKIALLFNLFEVWIGKKTWIGFIPGDENLRGLPKLKKSVLHASPTLETIGKNERGNNLHYARFYGVGIDISMVLTNFWRLDTRR